MPCYTVYIDMFFSMKWSVIAMLIGKKDHTSIRKKYEQRSNAAVKIALDKISQAALAPYVSMCIYMAAVPVRSRPTKVMWICYWRWIRVSTHLRTKLSRS